ncbi:MAG TPA: hypothetical protein VFE46_13625 [Pirellulales bacterium]|jgi:hypothetical protein|nr:hypothetical protein [Pirellulales bacterium]
MVIITANEVVQAALAGIAEKAEIRDSQGKLIGYFEPSDVKKQLLEEARQHFDPDDIKNRKTVTDSGVTTSEMLAHLRSLAPEQ